MQNWGYLSGLLRAEKNQQLTNNQFNAFIESANIETMVKSLEDTVYGSLFQERSIKEFTQIFDAYSQQKQQQISELLPCPILMSMYALKTDLNNFKLCYKAKRNQSTISWEALAEGGTISPEHMFLIVEQGLWNELPKIVAGMVVVLEDETIDSLRKVDFLIDKSYYQHRIQVLEEAAKHQPEFYNPIVNLYKKEVDCENIKNILRAKHMDMPKESIVEMIIPKGYLSAEFFADYAHFSPEDLVELILDTEYGVPLQEGVEYWSQHRSCTILEKQIDEYLLQISSSFSYQSEGPAVVEEALRALTIEIKNLKLIIIGKINNMKNDEIKERVRHVSY